MSALRAYRRRAIEMCAAGKRGLVPVILLRSAICFVPGLLWGVEANVSGRVGDENSSAISGVRVSLSRENGAMRPMAGYTAVTGTDGRFIVSLPSFGMWNLAVHHEGFYAVVQRIDISRNSQELYLILTRRRPLYQNLQVNAEAAALDLNRTNDQRNLSGPNLVNIPYSGRDLRGALKFMPGVVQDAKERLHLAGGSPNQALYTLDGFNVTDPLTGRFSSRLNVDSVRSVEYSAGRYSPEFGKGSADVVAISTEMGSDRLRYSATNFVPGIDMRGGAHIGTWAPRFGLSGPVSKGRAWFSGSSGMEYSHWWWKTSNRNEPNAESAPEPLAANANQPAALQHILRFLPDELVERTRLGLERTRSSVIDYQSPNPYLVLQPQRPDVPRA
jgi:hypothetical protein